MKHRKLKRYRISAIIVLLLTILMVFLAYFKMDSLFTNSNMGDISFQFQAFVWGIIILSTISYFISWRLILNVDASNADYKDNIDKKELKYEGKVKEKKEYSIDINELFDSNTESMNSNDAMKMYITKLCRNLELDLSISFKRNENNEFENWINYALYSDHKPESFTEGDGINGQVALDKKALHLKDIPENYVKITSGSGDILPTNIYILPIIVNKQTKYILEFADMKSIDSNSFEILQNFATEYTNRLNK